MGVASFAHVTWEKYRYKRWISAYESWTKCDLDALAGSVRALPLQPVISLIVPVFNTPSRYLVEMIESVRAQVYPYWELCLADDSSDASHVGPLLRRFVDEDTRIKMISRFVNGHISAASNSALSLATGEYIALLDHDDLLAPHALAMVVKYLNNQRHARLLYSDEDKISERGGRHSPYFKPGWDPELILQINYFSHLGVFETALVREIGGFREGFEGSQDHDLVLRCVHRAGNSAVVHIPHVLYHWRTSPQSTARKSATKPYAEGARARAVVEYLAKVGRSGVVAASRAGIPFMSLDYRLPTVVPAVLILVDAKGPSDRLASCLRSLLEVTNYSNYRVVVVGDRLCRGQLDLGPDKVSFLESNDGERAAVVMNQVIASSACALVCLLDSGTRVDDPLWLARLICHAVMHDVGLSGARWFSEDGRLIAAGMVRTGLGSWALARPGRLRSDPGYFGLNLLTRQVSLLPGTGIAARRSVFMKAGGVPEDTESWGEMGVVLSENINKLGLRNVLVATSILVRDRKGADAAFECDRPRGGRYPVVGRSMDQTYNPNLGLNALGAPFRLGFPPRIGKFD